MPKVKTCIVGFPKKQILIFRIAAFKNAMKLGIKVTEWARLRELTGDPVSEDIKMALAPHLWGTEKWKSHVS